MMTMMRINSLNRLVSSWLFQAFQKF
ncbi:hypothetical protein Cantr_00226, partial [Candida viswanathii]